MRYKFNRLFRAITIIPTVILIGLMCAFGYIPYWIWVGSHLDIEIDLLNPYMRFLDKHFPLKPKENKID